METLLVLLETLALGKLAGGFGVGIVAFAAAIGIGKIGGSAMEAMGRQPEAAGDIRTGMIISAALIEGVSLFSVVVCLLTVLG